MNPKLSTILAPLVPALKQLLVYLQGMQPQTQTMLQKLALAIRDYEGAPGDLNYLLNNPGDCRPSPDGYLPKYEPVVIVDTDTDPTYPFHRGSFAKFPSCDIGWLYLNNLLENMIENHPDWTLFQLTSAYAPSTDGNDPAHYAQFLGKRLGVDYQTYQIKNILV